MRPVDPKYQDVPYEERLKRRLEELRSIISRVSVGDLTVDPEIPDEEDEFTELFVGMRILIQAINEKEERLQKRSPYIFFKREGMYEKVWAQDIHFIKARNMNVQLRTDQGSFEMGGPLGTVEEQLPSSSFLRIHRSYIINLDRVDRFDQEIVEIGDRSIPISRSSYAELKKRLNLI